MSERTFHLLENIPKCKYLALIRKPKHTQLRDDFKHGAPILPLHQGHHQRPASPWDTTSAMRPAGTPTSATRPAGTPTARPQDRLQLHKPLCPQLTRVSPRVTAPWQGRAQARPSVPQHPVFPWVQVPAHLESGELKSRAATPGKVLVTPPWPLHLAAAAAQRGELKIPHFLTITFPYKAELSCPRSRYRRQRRGRLLRAAPPDTRPLHTLSAVSFIFDQHTPTLTLPTAANTHRKHCVMVESIPQSVIRVQIH